ncbi:hypothetical protein BDN70DRAFT_872278 [Pholiota conissans]|uniref:BRCT domain-containing protein n=1 Tax=Pholiota conissans TaxID=109636 RepID=A0A9P6CZ28_9AGAR|nr:hypothetical protein BDN70DRAFT_872278 [Pholiota conissans]
MDAFDNGDPDSSQATQMIQDLLERDNSPGKRTDSRSSALKTQNYHFNENSSDSIPSSRTSHSIPQYHFHGLVSTQTQSQHYGDDEEPQEGSQKENIGAVKLSKESPPMRPSSPEASSSRNLAARAPSADLRGDAASAYEKGPIKKPTNVAFQSPRPKGGMVAGTSKPNTIHKAYKATAQPPSRYRAPPRPPARASSQDSFANDPRINEQYFVSKADQFVTPLSELGGRSSPSYDLDTTTSTSLGDSMYGHSRSTRQATARSPPRGKILVESTPSNSSQSQSQLSEDEHPSVSDRYQDGHPAYPLQGEQAHNRYRNNNYPNSYDMPPNRQLSPPDIHPDLLATQPSTQPSVPADFPATQPSTQTDNPYTAEIDNNMSHSATVEMAATWIIPRAPRSLALSVPKEKQHRYRQEGNVQNSTPFVRMEHPFLDQPEPATSIAQSDCQETQPSYPEPPPPRRGFPIKPLTSTNPSIPSTTNVDSMEVVPDSEPSRSRKFHSPAKPPTQQPQHIQPSVPVPAQATTSNLEGPEAHEDVEMRTAHEVVVEQEEEEDEEEEEVPLAKVAPPAKRPRGRPPGSGKKGINNKGKEKEAPPPVQTAKGKQVAQPTKFTQKPAVPQFHMRTKHVPSSETAEVPSSMPEQDIPKNTRAMRNRVPTEPSKRSVQKRPASKASSRSTSNATTSHRRHAEDDEGGGCEREGDDDTELADEEYQDAYEDNSLSPPRKRKRTEKGEAVASGYRGTAKRPKRMAPTPGTRSSGKAFASTATRGTPGSRVFALWTQDGHYYPGTVHSTDNHLLYNIKFDDQTEAWVSIDDIRICDLRIGDDVLFGNRARPAKITNVDGLKDGFVRIGDDGKIEEKAVSELRIAHKTILFTWADRKVTPQTISTTVKPVRKQPSPSPSKLSMVGVPTDKRGSRKKVLPNTGLIITLSAHNQSPKKERENVLNAVNDSGGFLIEDMKDVIKMEGKLSASNNRWTITKSEVKWIGNTAMHRLFLVADDYNQKPKYLMAIALGIPCLSTSWLQTCVNLGEEKDWTGFLLPQGYSDALKARLSQQIDIDWGNSIHHLTDIMNNPVARKLYTGKSILCVGHDMICPPKTKRRTGTDERALEASTALPRIILAMGAEIVEAVTEARYASKSLADYDYLVIKEPEQYLREYSQCTTVHWPYVKQCLLASRHLPLPVWPKEAEEEYSQET